MKKIFILVLFLSIFLGGCNKKEKEEPIQIKEKEEIKEIETYKDLNNTPICFYELRNNTLTKLTSINKTLSNLEDIGLFQVYPSCKENINLTKSFAESFKEEWDKYNKGTLKMGYNLTFNTKEESTITFNILSPDNTMEHWEYIMAYLYDDYANRTKGYYSHLESNEYNENSLLTAIKLQSNYK
ncbi:MAG: hypothetical protein IKE70_05475, partial [Bacilli bacterium]|nr:hypothetical protein [Bacilli bacterium]